MDRRELPAGKNVASARWVFDVKRGNDGRIERFKARLVVRDFSQRSGEDFVDNLHRYSAWKV